MQQGRYSYLMGGSIPSLPNLTRREQMKIFMWFIVLCGAFVAYSGLMMSDSIGLHWASFESWFCFLLTCIGVLSCGAGLLALSEFKRN